MGLDYYPWHRTKFSSASRLGPCAAALKPNTTCSIFGYAWVERTWPSIVGGIERGLPVVQPRFFGGCLRFFSSRAF
jgi:hypothetical protein